MLSSDQTFLRIWTLCNFRSDLLIYCPNFLHWLLFSAQPSWTETPPAAFKSIALRRTSQLLNHRQIYTAAIANPPPDTVLTHPSLTPTSQAQHSAPGPARSTKDIDVQAYIEANYTPYAGQPLRTLFFYKLHRNKLECFVPIKFCVLRYMLMIFQVT